jgi:hypothetical protein
MDEAPRPPPPVYQPEILGEAVYLAGTRKRRDWKVTGSTVGFAVGNAIAPGLLDLIAGIVGVRAQKSTRPGVVDARDPTPFSASTRSAGMHGPFDREALSRSAQWAFNKSPAAVRFTVGLLAIGMLHAARGNAGRRIR